MKYIYIIIHGEAYHDIGYNLYGKKALYSKIYYNSNLTNNGIEHAKKIKNFFDNISNLNIDEMLIIISPLGRALDTGSIIFPNRQFTVNNDIRELCHMYPCNRRMNRSKLIKLYKMGDFNNLSSECDFIYDKGDSYFRFKKFIEYLKNYNVKGYIIITHPKIFEKIICGFLDCYFIQSGLYLATI